MLNSNEPIFKSCSSSKISQSMLNAALVIEMVNNSFSENKNNVGCLRKRGML